MPNENTPTGAASELSDGFAVLPACKGTNCGCTDGRSHSPECLAEYEECMKMPYDERWLHCPDDGRGWKCSVCNYGGEENAPYNRICTNCHCHR